MQESSTRPLVAAHVLSERTHLAIPSLPHWIEPTVEYLRHKAIQCGACQESRAGKLMIALLEALANAVVHGNLQISSDLKERGDDAFARALAERTADPVLSARLVDIYVDYDGEACRWTITDEGEGFDVDRVLARCLSDDPDIMLASGRGILMMHSFLDEIHYDRGGRRLTMTLRRPSGTEKRREPRRPVHEPFHVAPVKPDGSPDVAAAAVAVSQDVSEGGVALLHDRLAEGQRVFIGIPSEGKTIYVPAAVRHCRTLAAGSVQIGCEFEVVSPAAPAVESSTPEQIDQMHQAILDVLALYEAPGLPADERRAHPRTAFNEVVSIESGDDGAATTGYARDMSKGGMAVITRVSLPLGGAIITLPRKDAIPLRIRARVVRCNRIQDGYHDVGLQFLRLAALA